MEDQGSSDEDKREAGERAKRQGRLGQKEASLLLSRARLTVNESTEDDEGWDLFVQFPTSLEVTSFLDTAPPAHNCLVQVKTIEAPDARVRMKLSNALKLAKAPVPSFVLVALVPDDRIEKLWLLHCGAEFVEAALERAANAPSSPAKTLNKMLLDVSVSDDCSVAVDGTALKDAMGAHLVDSPASYFEKKQAWLRDVGYGEARKQLGVTFREAPTDADYEELADFAVGMRDSLPVRRVDVADLRFGLERHERTLDNPEFFWPTIPTGPAIDLVVQGSREEARVRCTSHLARAVFPFLPERFNRFVLRAPFLRLFSWKKGEHFSMRWSCGPFDDLSVRELDEAAMAVRCVRLVRAGGASVFVGGMTKQAIPMDTSNLTESGSDLRFLEDAAVVAPLMELPPGHMLTFDEIADQRQRLQLIGLAISGTDAGPEMQFPAGSLPGNPAVGEICALLMLPWVRFGDVLMVCVLAVVAPLEASADDASRHLLKASRLRLLGRRVVRGDVDPDVNAMFSEADDVLGREGVTRVYRP